MYQFFLQTADAMVGQYLRFFTFLSHQEIEALDAETAAAPHKRAAQRALAREVVALVHGAEEVTKCEEASAALFSEEIANLSEELLLAVTEDAPSTDIAAQSVHDGLSLIDALEQSGLASSRKEARRTIEQGGAYVNNGRQTDIERKLGPEDLLHGRYIVLRKGPRGIHVLRAG
jgi:tyrosyl-tRNA synthetase